MFEVVEEVSREIASLNQKWKLTMTQAEQLPPIIVDGCPWWNWSQHGLQLDIIMDSDQLEQWVPLIGRHVGVTLEGISTPIRYKVLEVNYATEESGVWAPHVALGVDL